MLVFPFRRMTEGAFEFAVFKRDIPTYFFEAKSSWPKSTYVILPTPPARALSASSAR